MTIQADLSSLASTPSHPPTVLALVQQRSSALSWAPIDRIVPCPASRPATGFVVLRETAHLSSKATVIFGSQLHSCPYRLAMVTAFLAAIELR